MFSVAVDHMFETDNPIDFAQDIACSQNWQCIRTSDHTISISIQVEDKNYNVKLEWQEECSALLFSASLAVKIENMHYETALGTIEQINQNLWMGHFDFSGAEGNPTYRYTLLCRTNDGNNALKETIHDLFNIALSECNRFYTTFEMIRDGDIRLHDNLQAIVFETLGEA